MRARTMSKGAAAMAALAFLFVILVAVSFAYFGTRNSVVYRVVTVDADTDDPQQQPTQTHQYVIPAFEQSNVYEDEEDDEVDDSGYDDADANHEEYGGSGDGGGGGYGGASRADAVKLDSIAEEVNEPPSKPNGFDDSGANKKAQSLESAFVEHASEEINKPV